MYLNFYKKHYKIYTLMYITAYGKKIINPSFEKKN